MIAGGNIHLENIDTKDGEDKGLGWKIFKEIIIHNIDNGGLSARKSLEIMGTKVVFRMTKSLNFSNRNVLELKRRTKISCIMNHHRARRR